MNDYGEVSIICIHLRQFIPCVLLMRPYPHCTGSRQLWNTNTVIPIHQTCRIYPRYIHIEHVLPPYLFQFFARFNPFYLHIILPRMLGDLQSVIQNHLRVHQDFWKPHGTSPRSLFLNDQILFQCECVHPFFLCTAKNVSIKQYGMPERSPELTLTSCLVDPIIIEGNIVDFTELKVLRDLSMHCIR